MAKPVKKKVAKATKPAARPRGAEPADKAKASRARTVAHLPRFDGSAYRLPVLDLVEAVALASALLEVVPTRPTAIVSDDASRMASARDRANKALRGASDDAAARSFDVAMDRAWATFVRRIEDHVELPLERRVEPADTAKAYAIVRDLSILKLNYLAEFAQIAARLDALKREGLFDLARTLAGPAFLDEVLARHAEYGEALGVMGDPDTAAVDRGETRTALVESIGEYVTQVIALARAGKPEVWADVERALQPVLAHRATKDRARGAVSPRKKPPHPPLESRA